MMTCSVSEQELALVSLLAPKSASQVFTDGALANAVDWEILAAEAAREDEGDLILVWTLSEG